MNRILFTVVVMLMITGCRTDEPTPPADFMVKYQISMERIEVPLQVAPDKPLVVKLHGVVGANSSYEFDYADTVQSASLFDLTLYGLHNEDPDLMFLSVLIEWHGREFVKQPPHVDPVRVIVHQADGSVLEKKVTVGQ